MGYYYLVQSVSALSCKLWHGLEHGQHMSTNYHKDVCAHFWVVCMTRSRGKQWYALFLQMQFTHFPFVQFRRLLYQNTLYLLLSRFRYQKTRTLSYIPRKNDFKIRNCNKAYHCYNFRSATVDAVLSNFSLKNCSARDVLSPQINQNVRVISCIWQAWKI